MMRGIILCAAGSVIAGVGGIFMALAVDPSPIESIGFGVLTAFGGLICYVAGLLEARP